MKKILGLDLGTNSIGWALVNEAENEIIGIGSRIIPMDAAILSDFDKGNSKSQTSDRTTFRGTRRLRERHLLRRERLHRVLHIMGFLPKHYEEHLDFKNRLGQFIPETEPKLAYRRNENDEFEFVFKNSFNEMVAEFKNSQPHLFNIKNNGKTTSIPYDWTIYYLRKKALTEKIQKEELAWLLLNFNQKRGYYQLRGEEEEENPNKLVEFHELKVVDVIADEAQKGKTDIWYSVILENGWIYRRSNKTPMFDWIGKTKQFIVTTDLNDDGSVKLDKEGKEKRSFRAPSEDDWTLLKKKTEFDIDNSNKTVGCFIYDTLLQNPNQKINGKLVRTIERKFYKNELNAILEKQKEFHSELQNNQLLEDCIEELYRYNEPHQKLRKAQNFTKLLIDDIIFYQRPLKSKKSLISDCPYEFRTYLQNGEKKKDSIKCISKSHPLFQEFRLWQFVENIKIYEREKTVDGKLKTDVDVTHEFLKTDEDYVALFNWLNDRKEIKQDTLLNSYFKIKKTKGEATLPFRWNYVEDKEYPCNETRAQILNRLSKVSSVPEDFLTTEKLEALWHILYSVEDKHEILLALKSFAAKHKLSEDFVDVFAKFPPFKKEYGAYSEKAIKKLLPLMRKGRYWSADAIHEQTRKRIEKIISGEYDENIKNRVRDKAINLTEINHFKGLPLWLACYIVYDRHSEANDIKKWKSPQDIEDFLRTEFKQHSLRNPIVEQVVTETLRVVKDIWKNLGEFTEIHIELGREMKNPADKRKKMTQQISDNENTNLRIKALLMEMLNDPEISDVRPYSPSQQEILKIYEDGVLNSNIELPDDILKISKQNQPSKNELVRYKLWLDQKYRSPYTGEMIPLAKLFTTDYQIEHIIPQSRYFDDSFTNKVICEAEVNKDKDNSLGYEYIKNNEGKIIELSYGKKVKIFTINQYEEHVKSHFAKNRGKMKKLLMEDIPDGFIERQMNDSRYISKVVKSLLSNIVRENDEQEATSKHVISCSGGVTSKLKQDWGLNDVWNSIITPRFERLNELTQSNKFGEWTNKGGNQVFQTEVPLELQKGFTKKRIDHRHHALDALVIACATRNHINYLNNEHARQKDDQIRYELRNKLRRLEDVELVRVENGEKVLRKIKVAKEFYKPWNTFTQDAKVALENVIVSFKQNLRVINKTVNKYQSWKDEDGNLRTDKNGNPIKAITKQTTGNSWAIRKPLHKDTIYGQISLRFKKEVTLSVALDNPDFIVDKLLKAKVKELISLGYDKKLLSKYFKDRENKLDNEDVSRTEIYYLQDDLVASRTKLDESFSQKKIEESITDTGIQKILINHLNQEKYQNQVDEKGKVITPETLAFSPEGIDDMNKNILELNDGLFHQPIQKIRTYEPKGNKFNVGVSGNKKDKFVEAAKGTNLFFAIYEGENKKRIYETVPLNVIIEHQKQTANFPKNEKTDVPINNEKGKFLFSLSPNDLVYVPSEEEMENPHLVDFNKLSNLQVKSIYKMVSSTGNQCFFINHNIANSIVNKFEYSALNKMEKSIDGNMIKEICWKLKLDRLGNIVGVIK